MMNYNPDILKIVSQIIPRVLRKDRFAAIVFALLKPLQELNDIFSAWADKIKVKLIYNSQTIYLEKILNDLFDNTRRGIEVVTTVRSVEIMMTNVSEGLTPIYIYNGSEGVTEPYLFNEDESFDHEFEVRIPTELASVSSRISAQVDDRRLPEKRFSIIEI